MKTLYLIRHAKSSWDDPELSDFDRPLNERGKKDAPRMGKRLKERNVVADLMLSSPAKRAFSTCKRIAEALAFNKANIKTSQELYHADEDEILEVVRRLPDNRDVVLIYGHNPGLTDFTNSMNHDRSRLIRNIPTCGVACFQFEFDSWKKVEFGTGTMIFYDFPKSKAD